VVQSRVPLTNGTPAKSYYESWARLKDRELAGYFADFPSIFSAIESSEWCREPWFTFHSLFQHVKDSREWKVGRLLAGGYRGGNKQTQTEANLRATQQWLEEGGPDGT
jgi:hypothetical protein